MEQYSRSPQKTKRRHNTVLIVIGIAIVLLIVAGAILLLHQHKPKPTGSTGNSYTKGITPSPQSTPSSTDSSTGNPSQQTGKEPGAASGQGTPSTTNAPLTAPWGTFVNVYNAKTTDQMGSTCNTTPGATCQISFTSNGITKSLSAQTTDAGGAAYWAWKPTDIGLSPGVWHITATAVLGSQTKTTNNDPLTLTLTQ